MNINDLKEALTPPPKALNGLPPHIASFITIMVPERRDYLTTLVSEYLDAKEQTTDYGSVGCLGFALAVGEKRKDLPDKFRAEIERLSGRTFFATGRAARFEIDGIALLGVAAGVAAVDAGECDTTWLTDLLRQSEDALKEDAWQTSLVKAARALLHDGDWSTIPDVRLRVALPFVLGKTPDPSDRQLAWEECVQSNENDDLTKTSVKRAVFEHCVSALAALPINGATVSELITLLQNVSESLSHWTFEVKQRVRNAPLRQWHIDHEYHVQNLLWTVLKPIFPDLVDEESLPKIGHMTPRYDLGIPSLQTIIEVKYMKHSGQSACKKVTEEIAADSSLYLSSGTGYQRIIAFVWDDCRQTEEYRLLRDGLESLDGIEKAIILPRPLRMERKD